MDELERAKYAIRKKIEEDNMNKEDEETIEELFTKKDLIDIISGFRKNHFTLIKWLYDVYPEILREYEKKSRIHIYFAGKNDE